LRFLDSHGHPQFDDYDADRAEVLARMRSAGVAALAVGTDAGSSQRAVELSQHHRDIWAAVGFHPNDLPKSEAEFANVSGLAADPRVVAVGESGLDYFRSVNPNEQQRWFSRHLDLAKRSRKAAIVHLRDKPGQYKAYDDALSVLAAYPGLPFVLHCYSGDAERARRALELGGYISFTGILTFNNADAMRSVAKSVPLERILIETDAPYLAPEPNRGTRNEPAFVVRVAEALAELHSVPLVRIAEQTTANARSLFRLPTLPS
jgi:TatD DNase family protein